MYGWVRPRIVVPVHGEALHLAEHAAFARRLGIPEVIVSENGDLIRLAPGPADIVDEVPAARVYKDGRLLVEADVRTVPDRRRLSFSGMASVALALTEKGELAADPDIELIGIPAQTADGETFDDIAYDAVMETFESLPRARRRDPDVVAEAVRGAVRSAIAQHWGKKPMCHVHVLPV
jgi:ribonuclease J